MRAEGVRPVILLLGANGQVGAELVRSLAPLGRVVALARADLCLTDAERIRSVVRSVRPRIIVNAAAHTVVDGAEHDLDRAYAINGAAPGILAEEAARLNGMLVHYSTDHVFDGTKGAPYTECDEPNPLNVYGASKLAGERAIRAVGVPHLIFRASWVYGVRGRNFLRTILHLARERHELRIVDDQVGCPTWSRMLAMATAMVLVRIQKNGEFESPDQWTGTYHLCAAGQTTWFDFARTILALDPRREEQVCRCVAAIGTHEYPTPARRPRFSVLDTTRVAERFGLWIAEWRDDLALALREPFAMA
jgi:dTDP-4-dehydrorhamnose reductase